MSRNQVVRQFFGVNQNWTAPAGVKSVRVSVINANDILAAVTGAAVGLSRNTNGDLYAWGANGSGQLGVGDVTNRSSPVPVVGGVSFKRMSSGGTSGSSGFTAGLDVNGNAYAWGINTNGNLGTGDVTSRSSPVAVLGGLTFEEISAGGTGGNFNTVALTAAGAAYAWGMNANGQLGLGDVTPRSSPVAVLGGLTFGSVRTGTQHSAGITTGGVAYAWGLNLNGQLGIGDVNARSSPVAVLGGFTTWSKITPNKGSSSAFMAGILTSGVAYGWGVNASGQLGLGDVTPRSSPVAVLGGLTFADIGCGGAHTVGITAAGVAYAWGNNSSGQLGVGDVTPRSSPVAVLGGLTFAAISAGFLTTIGLTTGGDVYAWGQNTGSELGTGDQTPRSSPVAVLKSGNIALASLVLNVAVITVVPGTVYAITSLNSAAFGSNSLWLSGFQNIVMLEYFA